MEPARRPHLVSCPHCSASNPVNASACWHCEHELRGGAAATPALPGAEAAPDSESAPPSFFPVLREEVDGVVAHNDSIWEGAAPEPPPVVAWAAEGGTPVQAARPGAAGRLIAAALGGAVLASLAFLLSGRGEDPVPVPAPAPALPRAAAPQDTIVTPVRTALPAPAAEPSTGLPSTVTPPPPTAPAAVARPVAAPAATAPAPTAVAPRTPRSPRPEPRAEPTRTAVVDPQVPTPAPVKGPCTPNVAALGLCSIDTR